VVILPALFENLNPAANKNGLGYYTNWDNGCFCSHRVGRQPAAEKGIVKMKTIAKTIWMLTVALFCCPDTFCQGVVKIDIKYSFNDLLDAIAQKESGGDPNAYNESEDAAGLYQIRPIYLTDVNRILGYPKYKLSDRYNPEKSRDMVAVYLMYYGRRKGLEAMARIHNGGPRGDKKECTESYWLDVKNILEESAK